MEDPLDIKDLNRSGIIEIPWKHVSQDKEHVWVSQKGEGTSWGGTGKYVIAVHFFEDGGIAKPYVMVNLNTRPGGFVFDGGTYNYHFHFFDPNGKYVGTEGTGCGEPIMVFQNFKTDRLRVVGGFNQDYTTQVREQLRTLPDPAVIQSIDGFFRDEPGLPEAERDRLHEGFPSLAHLYNRESIFYEGLTQAEARAGTPGFFGFNFHEELGDCLVKQLYD